MKSILPLILSMLLLASPSASGDNRISYKDVHPRLLMDGKDFRRLQKDVSRDDNEALNLLHANQMAIADSCLALKPLEYKKDASNKRILAVSREAVMRMTALSYAYRYTGDVKYLEAGEKVLRTVCSFPDWNPSHYLDVGEMSFAVAFGYDWMYDGLSEDTKALVRKALRAFAFDTSLDRRRTGFYYNSNNWNQVCNGGLVCAALGTLPAGDTCMVRIVDRAVESNSGAMKMYAPDGNYPEGPSYWGYGTQWEVLMLTAFESVLGHDFGLSNAEGFLRTGTYMAWSIGNAGKVFNFSDNGPKQTLNNPLWYFAYKTGDASTVWKDMEMYRSGVVSRDRLLILALIYADKIGPLKDVVPEGRVYCGRGENPIAICRTGLGSDDLYLGVKGGSASVNHAHMDAGSYVFDARGVRWVGEIPYPPYAKSEVELKAIGGDLWSRKPGSMRWKVPSYNNRCHNTLTVNDKDHVVEGFAPIVETFDSDGKLGATVDLTDIFGGDLESAVRTLSIVEGSSLEIRDALKAPAGRAASVRWTLVTQTCPSIDDSGITLTQDGKQMRLTVSGADVEFRQWPVAPEFRTFVLGFIFEVPAGSSKEVVVRLDPL